MKPVRTAARVMLSAIFVSSGVRILIKPDSKVDAARRVTDRVGPMLEKINPRIPTDARTLVRAKAAGDVVAGLALATGRFSRPAAAVLAAGLVPTTFAGHPFWAGDTSEQRAEMRTHFLKNLGMLGGLLLAAVDTEGQPGLRYRTEHAADRAGRAVGRSQRSMRHTVDRSQRSVRRAVRTARREAKIAAMAAAAARKMPG
ncbi:DoxX family membrane protein [Actinoplanes sp. NPDC051411]|uniref:DoxX family membrane protein n=1 Tax=Actinoplanes sp. NPDC051411 TaxID=3155522 RepID=UPI00343EABAA